MITICTFVILYLNTDGLPAAYRQKSTCRACAELVEAYLEAGPPHWYRDTMVVPGCIREDQEATPVSYAPSYR